MAIHEIFRAPPEKPAPGRSPRVAAVVRGCDYLARALACSMLSSMWARERECATPQENRDD
jgi:hypothetical protein